MGLMRVVKGEPGHGVRCELNNASWRYWLCFRYDIEKGHLRILVTNNYANGIHGLLLCCSGPPSSGILERTILHLTVLITIADNYVHYLYGMPE